MIKLLNDSKKIREYQRIFRKVGSYFPVSANNYAVIAGIKTLTKTEINPANKYLFKKIFELFGVYVSFGEVKSNSKIGVYLSKDKGLAEYYSKEDPEHKSETLKYFYKFSEALSYPSCCIKDYFSFFKTKKKESIKKLIEKLNESIKSPFCNWLLYPHNLSLSFHQPCTCSCKKTIEYNKNILYFIKKINPVYAFNISYWLNKPILLWLDQSQNIQSFHDNRFQITFEGTYSKKCINFDRYLLFNGLVSKKNSNKPSQKFIISLSKTKQLKIDKNLIQTSPDIIEKRNIFSGVIVRF